MNIAISAHASGPPVDLSVNLGLLAHIESRDLRDIAFGRLIDSNGRQRGQAKHQRNDHPQTSCLPSNPHNNSQSARC